MSAPKNTQGPLERAIAQRETDYRAALDRVREGAQSWDHLALREAVELAGCLRRLVRGRSVGEIHKAFGAPGDFGYETSIGDALARLYRGES